MSKKTTERRFIFSEIQTLFFLEESNINNSIKYKSSEPHLMYDQRLADFSDMCNSKRVGKKNLPVIWSQFEFLVTSHKATQQ
jgi:hypothetical protein